jgi:hypothetical protein
MKNLNLINYENKEEWANLLSLNFDIISKQSIDNEKILHYLKLQKELWFDGNCQVRNINLLRMHPFLSKISYQGVKDLLFYCNLVVVEKNHLLYR